MLNQTRALPTQGRAGGLIRDSAGTGSDRRLRLDIDKYPGSSDRADGPVIGPVAEDGPVLAGPAVGLHVSVQEKLVLNVLSMLRMLRMLRMRRILRMFRTSGFGSSLERNQERHHLMPRGLFWSGQQLLPGKLRRIW